MQREPSFMPCELAEAKAEDNALAALDAPLTLAWRRFREAGQRGAFGDMVSAELHADALAGQMGALFRARGLDEHAIALALAESKARAMRAAQNGEMQNGEARAGERD